MKTVHGVWTGIQGTQFGSLHWIYTMLTTLKFHTCLKDTSGLLMILAPLFTPLSHIILTTYHILCPLTFLFAEAKSNFQGCRKQKLIRISYISIFSSFFSLCFAQGDYLRTRKTRLFKTWVISTTCFGQEMLYFPFFSSLINENITSFCVQPSPT